MPTDIKVATPVWLDARMTVERSLFTRQYQGVRVADMATLHVPGSMRTLREVALESVKKFIRDMALRGYEAIDEPGGFLLAGPYQSRGFEKARSGMTTQGWSQGEDPYEASADFVVRGQFLATRAKVIEQ